MRAERSPFERRIQDEYGDGVRPDSGEWDAGNMDQIVKNWDFQSNFKNATSPGSSGGGGVTLRSPSATTDIAGPGVTNGLSSVPGTPVGIGQTTSQSGGIMDSLFGGRKLDPTTLLLGGLSLLGGDEELFQRREGYSGAADPQKSLTDVLAAIDSLSQSYSQRPRRTPTSVVPAGPAPVTIEGIPFQIGGGMGTDPALRDPRVLGDPTPMPNPFAGSVGQTPPPGARRRNPSGGQ